MNKIMLGLLLVGLCCLANDAEKIKPGNHWEGPQFNKAIKGKVTLLVVWGGCVGCRHLTPGMVSLAKELKNEKFHLIASYCQAGTKEATLKFLKSKGWGKEMKNFSVVSQAWHTAMKGRHVPYYLIFDHKGKLRYHHMAGIYHGGDGDKYQKLVKQLLKEINPENSKTPETPENSKTPETPETPENSKTPETPEKSEMPMKPDNSAEKAKGEKHTVILKVTGMY